MHAANREVRLGDGVIIHPGDPVLEVHLWNEHLVVPPAGPDLRWVATTRRQFEASLSRLTEAMAVDPLLQPVRAAMIVPAFGGRRRQRNLRRLPHLLRSDWVSVPRRLNLAQRIHQFVDSTWLWLLAWTFNPRSLADADFIRHREEFWISRERFLAAYRTPRTTAPGRRSAPSQSSM